ncbi:hypothetical protein RND81_14G193500 [Saponaria officinalis]|uniref:Uncharacterized protein n=1 Tax=Saponaria officinalis TaxID=3572 RepID=A0AAW1GNU9_SAPOF
MASGDERSSSSSSGSDREDINENIERFPGFDEIGFATENHRARFEIILRRSVAPSRFLSTSMMTTLGLTEALRNICVGTGITGIYNSRALTFTDITYEFMSSYYTSGPKENPVAHYRIANYNVTTTVQEMAAILGVCGTGFYESPRPANRAILWTAMTGQPYPEDGKTHASAIQHPVLKLWFRLLGSTIFGRNEPDNINNYELDILDSYINIDHGPRYQINVAARIINHLERMARNNRVTPLQCGGIATILTKSFLEHFEPSDYMPTDRDPIAHQESCLLNLTYLRKSLYWLDDKNIWYHDNAPLLQLPSTNLPVIEPIPTTTQPLPCPVYYIRARRVPSTQRRRSRRSAAEAGPSTQAGTSSGAGPSTSTTYDQSTHSLPPQLDPQYGSAYSYYIPYPPGPVLPPFNSVPAEDRERIMWDTQQQLINTISLGFADLSLALYPSYEAHIRDGTVVPGDPHPSWFDLPRWSEQDDQDRMED